MSDTKTARERLADADHHHKIAEAADTIRLSIRLGGRPTLRGRLLGFFGHPRHPERAIDATETSALYEALGIVYSRHVAQAREIESTVTTTEGETR